ncbi:two-component system nitrate/nitrite response regulator NarL [Bradyrhizobium sp. cir1]|uniref:LuxR C-terminal-related transcriptional regulator n=1 Tax=Bradyrhizobium sp. cir1 TaxID=1445730 RepID=UPI0016060AB0|nr:response regulator transcription factor [Bradyrhizobium sp. cir1]MBB4370448.1 two-component system nitrate/nitrite response regulator NarL [Bradyrhizobium sp. cir1]
MPTRCVTVVIADRQPVVLQGWIDLLGASNGFRIVASCCDGTSCIDAIRSRVPDIAIFDIAMPDVSGLEILAIASAENIPTKLVLFTASIDEREFAIAAAAGVYGIIPKDVDTAFLLQSLRQVADGQRLASPSRSSGVVPREQGNFAPEQNVLDVLTDRERQIMRLVSEGLSNKEIGRKLNITDGTIKVHLHHIFQKLDVSNRTLLAALAMREES